MEIFLSTGRMRLQCLSRGVRSEEGISAAEYCTPSSSWGDIVGRKMYTSILTYVIKTPPFIHPTPRHAVQYRKQPANAQGTPNFKEELEIHSTRYSGVHLHGPFIKVVDKGNGDSVEDRGRGRHV